MPLTPPKVERATATGMRKANWPYSLPAKVCKEDFQNFGACQEIFSSHHSHCFRAEDLGHVECRVEGDVGGDVDDGHRDARDHDCAGEIPHRVLHLLDHKVEVVPTIVSKES